MHRIRLKLLQLVAAAVVGVAPVARGQVPVTTLTRPAATFDSGFTNLQGVRELSDGRVLLVDPDEMTVVILDAQLSRASPVGGRGAGPGEYSLPARILALGGDTSAVLDRAAMKLLVVLPEASMGGLLAARWEESCHLDGAVRLQAPRFIDAEGRYYSEAEPIRVVAGSLRPADSAAIERWNSKCARDTVAFVPSPVWPGGRVMGGLVVGDPMKPDIPFRSRTEWVVARDGRIAVIRPEPYRVDFVDRNGRRSNGNPIPYEPIPVTERIKSEWREVRKRPRYVDMTLRAGGSTRIRMNVPFIEPAAWPAYLPPFQPEAVFFAPDGKLWISRTTNVGEPPICDVVDEAGRVVQQVRLRPRSRVIGFGRGTVYVARRDDDDLQYLERYKLP